MKPKSYTTIWKFPIEIKDLNVIEMPKGSRILDFQDMEIWGQKTGMIWALVNPDNEKEERRFRIVGTGNPLPQEIALNYIGTVAREFYVWHLFEEIV